MSIAQQQQLLALIATVAEQKKAVTDLQERVAVLERQQKEAKTLSLKKSG